MAQQGSSDRDRHGLDWSQRRMRNAVLRSKSSDRARLEKLLARVSAEPEDDVFRATVSQTGVNPHGQKPKDR